jgi:hypothetical protein
MAELAIKELVPTGNAVAGFIFSFAVHYASRPDIGSPYFGFLRHS